MADKGRPGRRIAVTPRSLSRDGHPELTRLTDAGFQLVYPDPGKLPSEAALEETLPGCVGYLAGVEPISRSVLNAAPGLRVISRNGVGIDNVDMEAAEELGIAVERAVGANSRGVAELAIGLMLAGLRSIPQSHHFLKQGDWKRYQGIEVQGRTLGVVGCGQIGQHVSRMALGLGMQVLGFDPYPDEAFNPGPGFSFGCLEEVMRRSDVITLHAPVADRPIVDRAAIETMEHAAFLINTARAGLVDESDVLAGLESGRISGYATDVFRTEPPEINDLLKHPRVVMTPHAGGFTEESVTRATKSAVDNILKHF